MLTLFVFVVGLTLLGSDMAVKRVKVSLFLDHSILPTASLDTKFN